MEQNYSLYLRKGNGPFNTCHKMTLFRLMVSLRQHDTSYTGPLRVFTEILENEHTLNPARYWTQKTLKTPNEEEKNMSKEMERFVTDVQKDEELAKLVHEKAGNLKSLSAALKEHGYEATDDEIKAFV